MYFGHINHFNAKAFPEAIQIALAYLKNTDFDQLPAGQYPIKERLIFAQVLDLETKPKAEILPEVHRHDLDVQYLHCGQERIGVAPELAAILLLRNIIRNAIFFFINQQKMRVN
ncbi:hypothetical protein AVEN109717_10995 [Avibacterium endocarditidis]